MDRKADLFMPMIGGACPIFWPRTAEPLFEAAWNYEDEEEMDWLMGTTPYRISLKEIQKGERRRKKISRHMSLRKLSTLSTGGYRVSASPILDCSKDTPYASSSRRSHHLPPIGASHARLSARSAQSTSSDDSSTITTAAHTVTVTGDDPNMTSSPGSTLARHSTVKVDKGTFKEADPMRKTKKQPLEAQRTFPETASTTAETPSGSTGGSSMGSTETRVKKISDTTGFSAKIANVAFVTDTTATPTKKISYTPFRSCNTGDLTSINSAVSSATVITKASVGKISDTWSGNEKASSRQAGRETPSSNRKTSPKKRIEDAPSFAAVKCTEKIVRGIHSSTAEISSMKIVAHRDAKGQPTTISVPLFTASSLTPVSFFPPTQTSLHITPPTTPALMCDVLHPIPTRLTPLSLRDFSVDSQVRAATLLRNVSKFVKDTLTSVVDRDRPSSPLHDLTVPPFGRGRSAPAGDTVCPLQDDHSASAKGPPFPTRATNRPLNDFIGRGPNPPIGRGPSPPFSRAPSPPFGRGPCTPFKKGLSSSTKGSSRKDYFSQHFGRRHASPTRLTAVSEVDSSRSTASSFLRDGSPRSTPTFNVVCSPDRIDYPISVSHITLRSRAGDPSCLCPVAGRSRVWRTASKATFQPRPLAETTAPTRKSICPALEDIPSGRKSFKRRRRTWAGNKLRMTREVPLSTLVVQWQLRFDILPYNMRELRVLLSQFAPVLAVWRLCPNLALVIFPDLRSAKRAVHYKTLGSPLCRVICQWLYPILLNPNFYFVLKNHV